MCPFYSFSGQKSGLLQLNVILYINTLRNKIELLEQPPHDKNENKDEFPDYYLENGYVVFTEYYHLKRGYCCGSGCRHCPYKHENVPSRSDNNQ